MDLEDKFILYDRYLKEKFGTGAGFVYVSAIDLFCRESGCQIYVRDDRKTGLTAADDAYLTVAASQYLAKQILASAVIADEPIWEATK